jgi:hypothetical protein
MNRRLFVLAGFAAAGCATLPPTLVAPRPDEVLAELETVHGFAAGPGGLRLTVSSHGCTARADWVFYAERREDRVALAFARRRLDTCRALPDGRTELFFPWRELGLASGVRVSLLNPVSTVR